MQLYLARHTETNYNVLGLSNSDPKVDVHLTPKGIEQAEALSTTLRNKRIDIAYTSDLSRTAETARYIIKDRPIKVKTDSRLNDLNMGYEGQPVDKYHKELFHAPDIWTAKFNDGESLLDLAGRVTSFLSDLREQNSKNVLIISHYTVLQLIIGHIKHIDKSEVLKIEINQGLYTKIQF